MRLSNWKHLNTKVLRVVHCDLSNDVMMAFAQRLNEAALVDFLRTLRVQLPAFEPLYMVEFLASNDPAVQAQAVARLSAATTAATRPKPPASEPSDPAPQPASGPPGVTPFGVKTMKVSPSPSGGGAGRAAGPGAFSEPSPVGRRPSMAQTNKILDAYVPLIRAILIPPILNSD
jgi:hypothetical protein